MPRTDTAARLLLLLAGVFGAVAVGAGAYASHGLGAAKDARAVGLWETASLYQMVHALAIVAIVALRQRAGAGRGLLTSGALLTAAGWLFAAGCLLFPGALYLLGWFGPGALGAVAPLGGLSFIMGWLMTGVAGLRGVGTSTGAGGG